MHARLVALAALALLVAGCAQSAHPSGATSSSNDGAPPIFVTVPETAARGSMAFKQSVITPAVGLAQDLYEPLIAVSKTGTIYVAAHVAGAVSTGTPAYVSTDDGKSWKSLPMLNSATAPSPLQGSAPPEGDEGAIVAGDDGHAYLADVSLHSFPVEGWCNDGATECYHNANAFDRAGATTGSCAEGGGSTAGSLNDRPWAAYANGTLLLSNNNGNGQVQLGVLQVPPALPADVRPATWNMCANPGVSGSIPGVPSMRRDLSFIVPQFDGTKTVNVVRGDAHTISVTSVVKAFEVTSHSADFGTDAYFGVSAADHAGNFYIAFENNTAKDGRFMVGLSTDGGLTFQPTTFATTSKVAFLYISGSQSGTGALVSWMQDSNTTGTADIYAAHLQPQAGGLALTDASLVASAVKVPCGDVMGSAPGPDGRAYVVVFADPAGCTDTPGSHPLSVYVQDKGGATV